MAVIPSSSAGKTLVAFTVLACLVICIFNRDLMDHVQNLPPLNLSFLQKKKYHKQLFAFQGFFYLDERDWQSYLKCESSQFGGVMIPQVI